jgi:hypothetical protein
VSASPLHIQVGEHRILQKPCSECKNWKPAHPKFFVPTGKTRMDGSVIFHSQCRTCMGTKRSGGLRTKRESIAAGDLRKAKLRARQRAWTKLARLHPEMFESFYQEELEAEGYSDVGDLRAAANRRKGEGKWRTVQCIAKTCRWKGNRRNIPESMKLPCPHCGRKVKAVT